MATFRPTVPIEIHEGFAGTTRLELATSAVTVPRSEPTELRPRKNLEDLAGAEGFEPPSSVLETDSLAAKLTPLCPRASCSPGATSLSIVKDLHLGLSPDLGGDGWAEATDLPILRPFERSSCSFL